MPFNEMCARNEAFKKYGNLSDFQIYDYRELSKNINDCIYEFNINTDQQITVIFENFNDKKEDFGTPDVQHCNNVADCSFYVNNMPIKYSNFDIETFIRIIKTVKEILLEWLSKGNSPDVISIMAISPIDHIKYGYFGMIKYDRVEYQYYEGILKNTISNIEEYNYVGGRTSFRDIRIISLKNKRLFKTNKKKK